MGRDQPGPSSTSRYRALRSRAGGELRLDRCLLQPFGASVATPDDTRRFDRRLAASAHEHLRVPWICAATPEPSS